MSTIEAFDLDALIAEQEAEQFTGPLGIVWGYLTTPELEQVAQHTHARSSSGGRSRTTTWTGTTRLLLERSAHAWHRDHHDDFSVAGHRFTVFSLDLRCACPHISYNTWTEYRDAGGCECVGALISRVQCDACAWHATGSDIYTLTAAHDHAAPGWRVLPVVPADLWPERGGPLRIEKGSGRDRTETEQIRAAVAFVNDHYPDWAKQPTMPTIAGERPGNHLRTGIDGYGTYGGYLFSDSALTVTEPAHGIGEPGWAMPIRMQDWEAERARGRAAAPALKLLPDIPGKVHGIVGLDPLTIQCDDCGVLAVQPEGQLPGTFLLTVGITFDRSRDRTLKRRCAKCWEKLA